MAAIKIKHSNVKSNTLPKTISCGTSSEDMLGVPMMNNTENVSYPELSNMLGETAIRVVQIMVNNPETYLDVREVDNNDGVFGWKVSTCRHCHGHSSYSSWEPGASTKVCHTQDCPYGVMEEIAKLAKKWMKGD